MMKLNGSFDVQSQACVIRTEQPWFILCAKEHYHFVRTNNLCISHFYSFEANQTGHTVTAIPDGCIDIVFGIDETGVAKGMVCGSKLNTTLAGLKHNERYFGVRFNYGIIPDCLDLTADQLLNQNILLNEIMPNTTNIIDDIVSASSIHEQVRIFENYFSDVSARKMSPVTINTLKLIRNSHGSAQIQQLEYILGYSSRTIQRLFKQDIGMSPKQLSRIIRNQALLDCLGSDPNLAFTDLACDLGFHDQSHLCREFKKLLKITPNQYQERLYKEEFNRKLVVYHA